MPRQQLLPFPRKSVGTLCAKYFWGGGYLRFLKQAPFFTLRGFARAPFYKQEDARARGKEASPNPKPKKAKVNLNAACRGAKSLGWCGYWVGMVW